MSKTLKEKIVKDLGITEIPSPKSPHDQIMNSASLIFDAFHASRGSLTQETFSIHGDFSRIDPEKLTGVIRSHYDAEGYELKEDGIEDLVFEKDGKRYLAMWDLFPNQLYNFRFRVLPN